MRLIDGRAGYRDGYEAGAGFSWLSALPVLAALGLVWSVLWISRGFDETASWAHFFGSVAAIIVLITFAIGLAISLVCWVVHVVMDIADAFRG